MNAWFAAAMMLASACSDVADDYGDITPSLEDGPIAYDLSALTEVQAIRAAELFGQLNTVTSTKVFTLSDGHSRNTIAVAGHGCSLPDHESVATASINGDRVVVCVLSFDDRFMFEAAVLHGLLHSLGFGHDDYDPDSVMAPEFSDAPVIRAHHIARIRELAEKG